MFQKIIWWLGGTLVIVIVALFWLNGTINYSGPGRDYGMVEKWFFNGPVEDALFKSVAERKWEEAARYSVFAVDDLNRYGNRLVREPSMSKQKYMVIENLDYSIRCARAVDDEYFLSKGRSDLKDKYRDWFIGGLASTKQGLESGDELLVMEGIQLYNQWGYFVQSK